MAEIILHEDYRGMLEKLTPEQVKNLVLGMMDYAEGKEPDFDFIVDMAFTCIRPRIDKDTEKYNRTLEQRRQAGIKSGEARSKKGTTVNESERPLTTVNETEREERTPTKATNINIDINKDLNTERENILKEKVTPVRAARFVKPTLGEVEAYCRERGNSISPQGFINYYEANGWKVGRNPMKDWKAAVRTWEARDGKTVAGSKPKNGFHNFTERKIDYDAIIRQEMEEAAKAEGI